MNIQMRYFTLLLLFISLNGFSQQTIDHSPAPYIEVTGIAEKKVVPDLIYISIVLKQSKVSKKELSLTELETKLKEGLESLGIDLKDLQLSDANADYVDLRWTKDDVIAQKQYSLLVRDAETLSKVFRKLKELKVEDAHISKVDHSKIVEIKKETRILAIKAAKEKASYLLMAIDEKLGKPISINENSTYFQAGLANNYKSNSLGSYANQANLSKTGRMDIQFKKITVSSSICIKYGIQ